MKLLQRNLHRIWRIFLNSDTVTLGHTRAHSTFIIPTFHPTHTHLPQTTATRTTKKQVQPQKALDSHLISTKQDSILTESQFDAYRSANIKSISDQKLPLDEQKILKEKFENMTYSSWLAKEQTMNSWQDEHEKSQKKAEKYSIYGL